MNENMWIDWLTKRGITPAIIDKFGISFQPHPVMGEAIVIPVFDATGVWAFNKYRRDPMQGDVKPKYVYDSGSRATVYGAYFIHEESSVLITEGELDALVAWSYQIPAVSSTGGAGTFLPEWSSYFKDKDVTICYDNDPAGAGGMVRVLSILPQASILFLPDRPGIKDISDYVGSGGDLNGLCLLLASLF